MIDHAALSLLVTRLEHGQINAVIQADDVAQEMYQMVDDATVQMADSAALYSHVLDGLYVRMYWRFYDYLAHTIHSVHGHTATALADVAPVHVFAKVGEAVLTPTGPATVEKTKRRKFQAALMPPLSKADVTRALQTARGAWSKAVQSKLADPKRIAAIVVKGEKDGLSRVEIARKLRPLLQGVGGSAARIARTAGAQVAHYARFKAYEQLGDLIVGYQLRAVMDSRTRPWHAARNGAIYYKHPKSGQAGMDQMPHPPHEPLAAPWYGQIAYNCRCFLVAVFAEPEGMTDDMRKPFLNAAGKTVPDPDSYAAWFAGANERQQRMAVGSRLFSSMVKMLGRKPHWSEMLDPATGELMTLTQLIREKPTKRKARKAQVDAMLELRRAALQQVATFGFALPH